MNRKSFDKRLEDARDFVTSDWSPERARRVEASMLRRGRSRARVRAAAKTVAVLGVVLVAVGGLSRWWRAPVERERTTISVQSATAQVESTPEAATLVAGAAWFTVRDAAKPYRVVAGQVEVVVGNARFLVERADGQVLVSVESGEVRVRWPGGTRSLAAGESGRFAAESAEPAQPADTRPPPVPVPVPDEPNTPTEPTTAPSRNERPPSRTKDARRTWQELARGGEFDAAWKQLPPSHAVRDLPEELLLAADVARLSHHSAEAVAPLQQCIARHANDPRTPLAAFTLGRVLLDELGRPRPAAEAFDTARRLAPEGPLAEDALARSVESWARAGETAKAHELAVDYLNRYPGGRRAAAVRHHGGVE